MSANKGFTLIEILVVIVIVGITIGFALLSFGDFGESKKILYAAEQLEKTLRLAQQQAILESSTFGLRVDNTSYQILKFKNATNWIANSSKKLFKVYYFPKNMVVNLKTNKNVSYGNPGIIINSSGEVNSFTLSFGSLKEKTMALLIGKANGELQFKLVPK